MEKAKYNEILCYVWECPKCGCFNEMGEDNPAYQETVFCDECDGEFEPEEA